jgi:hypothetical protein
VRQARGRVCGLDIQTHRRVVGSKCKPTGVRPGLGLRAGGWTRGIKVTEENDRIVGNGRIVGINGADGTDGIETCTSARPAGSGLRTAESAPAARAPRPAGPGLAPRAPAQGRVSE